MPKVTLIGQPWMSRTMVMGKKRLVFHGGEAVMVSVATALALRRVREDGKPVFRIENMPELVRAVHPPMVNPTKEPRQRKLMECRL